MAIVAYFVVMEQWYVRQYRKINPVVNIFRILYSRFYYNKGVQKGLIPIAESSFQVINFNFMP